MRISLKLLKANEDNFNKLFFNKPSLETALNLRNGTAGFSANNKM